MKVIERPVRTLVENRVSFGGPNAELSIYDTWLPASRVGLQAGEVLYCGMVTGRKVLHCPDRGILHFLPHESFVMAPGTQVAIDFPDADPSSPTTCLTIEITRERVAQLCDHLNHTRPLEPVLEGWQYRDVPYLLTSHTSATEALIRRMLDVFTESDPDRDVLIDLGISELVVRMLQLQTRDLLMQVCDATPDASGLTAAVNHIRAHLSEPLDIDVLCRLACMSRTRFYERFRQQLGCTPQAFQLQLRMEEACRRLARGEQVTRVGLDLGFSHPSHFTRRFQAVFGETPTRYRKRHRQVGTQ
ncbi:MAG: helix-turn-helix domain-containing protein [Gammaproteobacteria bacterium]|nr:MAG: helix-turn-helix domain-containing protein [Gammaproteobacteria bacterium]